jgi:hypothetical protein
MEMFAPFLTNDHAVIALLATAVFALSSVVVYQWHYTAKNTVPKWAWDRMVDNVNEILKLQERSLTIIKERLPK